MKILPILNSDSYKQFHHIMYPDNLTLLYSNLTPRKSRLKTDKAVWFGLQYYIKEYLIYQWNELFFQKDIEDIKKEYKRFHKNFSMVDDIDTTHIEKLHALGYMPLEIKALDEGSLVPMRVPFFTIKNTHPDFGWLVNFLETQMSTVIWDLTTVATISREYRQILDRYALETTGSKDFVQWQGHDFSMRGRSSIESSFNQAGHLLSFTGSDTIPAVMFLEKYYGADISKELVAGSVPASEHSVMMCGGEEAEIETFERLLDLFPTGIISVVSDTWNLWDVCTKFLPQLKEKVLAREGKLVIRPDSGDPVDIICGEKNYYIKYKSIEECEKDLDSNKVSCSLANVFVINNEYYTSLTVELNPSKHQLQKKNSTKYKGVIELLWDVFGGTVNEQGYKVLDSHIGAIYGDSITLDRAEQICERLKAKGFASTNVVLGIGSYTFNYNTRDTLGMAIKATYCELEENFLATPESVERGVRTICREIFKDPITDDGTKKSAKGLLMVTKDDNGDLILLDQMSWEEEEQGELKTVFKDGVLIKDQTLAEIRSRLN